VASSPPVERLIASLRRLPGIGEKSATRLAFFLLSAPDALAEELAGSIARLKKEIVLCEECFDLTGASPCELCRDPRRDATLVCVVEEPADRAAIERSGGFSGCYHVLGGALAPIDGIGPDQLRIAELVRRVGERGVREVILATNPNVEGDATAHYLAERLRGTGVRVTRIASGMPLGGDLEYADQVTIGRSLLHRREMGDAPDAAAPGLKRGA
jgi:recombination protein RecR